MLFNAIHDPDTATRIRILRPDDEREAETLPRLDSINNGFFSHEKEIEIDEQLQGKCPA